MRILVTNDDGIDAPGLLHLAQAMTDLGDVGVSAPDKEYSGAGAAIGAIWETQPHVSRRHLPGIPEAWAVNGPPALCVMYARFGAFGGDFDLVVSGINPGANVGRSVYHSGTIGACLSGRNGGWSGVAISQAAAGWGVEGQAWSEVIKLQKWSTAAKVAHAYVEGYIADPPSEVVVANLNVPNVEFEDLAGWAITEVGLEPPRSMASSVLVPRPESVDEFDVQIEWGERADLPLGTDGGAVEADMVSVTYLTRLEAESRSDLGTAEAALDRLLGTS